VGGDFVVDGVSISPALTWLCDFGVVTFSVGAAKSAVGADRCVRPWYVSVFLNNRCKRPSIILSGFFY